MRVNGDDMTESGVGMGVMGGWEQGKVLGRFDDGLARLGVLNLSYDRIS